MNFCRSNQNRINSRTILSILAFMSLSMAQCAIRNSSASEQLYSSDSVARFIAEAPRILEVALAPAGGWIAYTLTRGSIEQNQYTLELLLQRVSADRSSPASSAVCLARLVTEDGLYGSPFRPRWKPDGQRLTYFAEPVSSAQGRPLVEYDVPSGKTAPIPLHDTRLAVFVDGQPSRPPITAVSDNYRWSPSGHLLGFTAPLNTGNGLDPRRGVVVSANSAGSENRRNALFVLDLSNGIVEQLTPNSLHVIRFDWSPDEQALVLAATPDPEGLPQTRTDLFIVDRATRKLRTLVNQPGKDDNPHWSPDGKWIAFTSHFGVPIYSAGWAAVVPASGGEIIRLAGEDEPKLRDDEEIFWGPHSRSFYFGTWDHMTSRLMRADLPTGRVLPLSSDEEPYDDHFSLSQDGRKVAFTRETPARPPEVFVQTLPDGRFQQLTHLSDDFPLTSLVQIDTLAWPSRDRKFTIHGLLLTPRSAWSGTGEARHITSPLPSLVYLHGGPSMVPRFFENGNNGPRVGLAARGYAVLVPNTRGRGGYGAAFQRGIRDGSSYGRLPYEDMAAGVDLLVQRGIADSKRLGVCGFSYGGYLTSYVITQTDRFKAAVVFESAAVQLFTEAMTSPTTDWMLLNRDLYGISNPADPAERARLIAESPGLNVDRVKTPTLLTFGAKSHAWTVGRPLFSELQRFHVPSEFLVYAEGHGYDWPAAEADNLTYTADWIDFWVRGYEDTAPEKQAQYARWRKMRQDWEAATAVAATKAAKKE
jgi:dipeptidyl aminopeptidase/acylaminoacyl peptidase